MEVGKLTVEYRSNTGKNAVRRLRAEGKVPGICYGLGVDPLPIALETRALKKALDPSKRQNTVITMTVNGGTGGSKTVTVMLKDYQLNKIRQEVEHVDLVAIDVNKEVTTSVPLTFDGKMAGTVDGGQLHIEMRTLSVICKPADIPVSISADISPLAIGDVLHVSDLKLPTGVRAAVSEGEAVASCTAPQAEKSTAPAGEAAAEGAAAAAAPAKDAKGAAPAAKGAAPAAKAGEKKK